MATRSDLHMNGQYQRKPWGYLGCRPNSTGIVRAMTNPHYECHDVSDTVTKPFSEDQ